MRDQFRRSPVTRPAMPSPSTNPDKHNNGIPAKPFTPTLSSAFRPTVKPSLPLTPRLAHPGNTQTPKRPESSIIPPREDAATPDSIYLGINITPRSGHRTSRRDGHISSPEITSSAATHAGSYTSRPTVPVTPGYMRSERSPIRGYPRSEISKSTVSRGSNIDVPGSRTLPRPPSSSEGLNPTAKFFHADEARSGGSHEPEARPRTISKPAQTSTFFYADGSHDQDSHTDDSSKGIPPKRRSTGSGRLTGGTKSPSLLSPRLRTAQLVDPISRSSSEGSLQPSPNIEEVSVPRTAISAEPPTPGLTRPPQLPSHPTHRKSCSVDSTTNITSPHVTSRRVTPTSSSPFLPEPLSSPSEQLSHSPLITPNPPIQLIDHRDQPYTVPQSPIKFDGGPNAAGEDAVNARTERKVLDLEISNSSLLAINRTLERELRKQNAELRRFRRLSRSGRLSIATSLRSTSGGGLSAVSESGDISELSSTYSNDELSDESDPDSLDEGTVSPNSLGEHDSHHRVDDEKQFMLDLAKHQELLIDSQKLNQSLKRCIGWTEELIKEGRKALEYNVHVNDIEIGGRVLDPDELGEDLDRGHGLLSPAADVRGDFQFSALDALDNVLEEESLLEEAVDLNLDSEQ
ncbi:hypothetical protein TMatcc_004966 [Talaromyces marneffei ATCC 18224]|uniref:Uncharacterized protein n=1 Tax=Talaromyces marneffei (strain ATCC 18224 / CBS 334.59 / QM 7333) TaxID=441960 RepID=B6Q7Y6_TALMQ|nr:uncharacterized protein EYB26_000121 [Talaromyces marneffei]EEA26749.1 conserved hypothetical protein [Talaromyces marneffei ATCC 18224]KAE8557508.1 hypothetical protein EYB25_002215 [Talaromyces marneffei]QGA12477.1 hypothetical protein EYB26_000121 [Talaromyces marneffei]